MSVIDGTAATLAELFRAGNRRTVAGAVVCDGPMALALASHLTADELVRLRATVEAHLDAFGRPTGPLGPVVGGEARGGPVMVPLRGTVR
ncbi:MAG: hypothetical protein R3E44_09100 [Paracoccaceae bacterium]